MNLYLPVQIRNKKMHVLKLQVPQRGKKIKPIFSFIVERTEHCLLNIDTVTPILISDSGAARNIDISDHSFFIRRENVEAIKDYIDTTFIKDMPLYRASIVALDNLKNKTDNAKDCFVNLPTGTPDDDLLCLAADNMIEDHFVLIIDYKDATGNTYLDVIRYYMYHEGEATAASIDFGSEASQVRIVNTLANENLVSLFKEIADPSGEKWTNTHRFWQGSDEADENKGLFKSVFFIDQNPGMTKFGDVPMKNDENTFVQILNKYEADAVKDFEVYPNSKLLEIAGEDLGLSSKSINFPANNDKEVIATNPSISDGEQQEKISRIITSQFLYAIIHKIKNSEVCLRLILLVPNVYYQYKVHYLMESLYQDFDIFKQNDKSIKLRGMEVDVLSESDASFLGYNQSEEIKKGEYILIIDAGKGTTDFSILQKIDTDKKFRGIYRNGIPASGNVVTYSFYEALVDYCKQYWETDVVELLKKETARGDKIQFMDLLEKLKAEYSNNNWHKSGQNIDSKSKITNLSELNKAIRLEFIDKKNHIPNIESYIGIDPEGNMVGERNTNIQKITSMLYEKLNLFMQDNPGIKFAGAILTGRGFLFNPFAESIKQKLVDAKWIANKSLIHRINDIKAKNVCVIGAFRSNESFNINNNSSLISYPMVSTKQRQNIIGKILQILGIYKLLKLINRLNSQANDNAFFYNGITTFGKEQLVNISGRKYRIDTNLVDKCTLFFVGEHFLWQIGENEVKSLECKKAIADNRAVEQTDDNSLTKELVIKSLFPFVNKSIDIADFIDSHVEVQSLPENSSTSENNEEEATTHQQMPTDVILDDSYETSGDQDNILD